MTPHCSIKMMYNLSGELVENRKEMRGNVLIKDLEYVDDMAVVMTQWML